MTITQDIQSPHEISRAIRSQFDRKTGLGFELTVPDFEIHSIPRSEQTPEMRGVQVKIERTVNVERVPSTYSLEDYSRHTKSKSTHTHQDAR